MKANQDTQRDSFVLYKSFYGPIEGMTDDQLGRLFRAIFQWQIDGRADPAPDIQVAFGFIVNQFQVDNGKYRDRCERNQANGKLGGRPKKNRSVSQKPNGFFENPQKPTKTQQNPNDNENDNENDNDSKGVRGNEAPARKHEIFVKPSFSDVQSYCRERGNGIDPAAFIDHYESNGWMVGKTRMRDWKAAIRTWERRDRANGSTRNTGHEKVITRIDDLFNG